MFVQFGVVLDVLTPRAGAGTLTITLDSGLLRAVLTLSEAVSLKKRKKKGTGAITGGKMTTPLIPDPAGTGREILKAGRTPAMSLTAGCPEEKQKKRAVA